MVDVKDCRLLAEAVGQAALARSRQAAPSVCDGLDAELLSPGHCVVMMGKEPHQCFKPMLWRCCRCGLKLGNFDCSRNYRTK